ncbi:MAG: class I SAM-dependent DNA methyltransferase [Candidatus Stygibacter frigidus]|nr:class I SAM-dependent DNA methyltransferase [Candidatus Stygibacter frigidus]
MITGELKNKVDKIWTIFWTGGITNPLSVIEQFTYLLFIKGMDDRQNDLERNAELLGIELKEIFGEKQQHLRWKNFKQKNAIEMFDVVSKEVFPFIKTMHGDKDSAFSRYMEDAIFLIPTAQMLEKIVTNVDILQLADRDAKGDLYEYLLSKVSTAGTNGQFRTPRHIIKLMVELMKPTPTDCIIDPAAGTAGFLVTAGEYLERNHQNLFHEEHLREHYNTEMFTGFDMDSTMLRIGAMNMMLHGVENPRILYKDSLSEQNKDKEKYSLCLANPPFKGSLDYESVSADLLKITKTKKTEILFITLMLRMLKKGGRCATIVPDGVLFGSSNAQKALRKEIVENHQLQAVISMPSGVFKPYAGVSTAFIVFTKTGAGGTDKVWFYDMQADGYSLDDKRQKIDADDIPDIIKRFHNMGNEAKRKRTESSFMVPKAEIVENEYDLSINRYKEIVYDEIVYEEPEKIIADIKELEERIVKGIDELEGLI